MNIPNTYSVSGSTTAGTLFINKEFVIIKDPDLRGAIFHLGVVVSGLASGQEAVVTITSSREGYEDASATIKGSAK